MTKAERVAYYHKNIVHGVGLIAHSCGVPEPRLLQRKHVRIVMENGYSQSLDSLFPTPTVAHVQKEHS